MKHLKIVLSILLVFFLSITGFAQSEDDMDKEIFLDNTETADSKTQKTRWDVYGFLENNNQFAVSPDHPSGRHNVKLEGRGKVAARYGTDSLYAKSILNAYFYPDIPDQQMPHDNGKLAVQELYFFSRIKNIDIKIGKQLFQWGTGDVFQVTNYLDQADMRELVATDKDDRYNGMYALSMKILVSDFSLEGCLSPVHSPAVIPQGFWALQPEAQQTPGGPVNVVIEDTRALDSSFNNISYALRAGGTIGELDFHLTYFNGINNNLTLNSVLTKDTTAAIPYTINLRPYYKRIHALGLDLAYAVDKFTIRAEASYVPNMPVQREATTDDMTAVFTTAAMGPDGEYTITDIETTTAFSYVLGADYLAWGDNGRIFVEWTQVWYPESDDYAESLFSKQLHIRLEDKWYNEYITGKLGATMRLDGDIGYVISAELSWDFKTGMTLTSGCFIFTGNNDEFFGLLEDNDMVYLKARMEY